MSGTRVLRVGILTMVLSATALPAAAQNDGQRSFSQMINVPALVDNYARFLARKYDLDDQQEAATLEILHKNTNDFLEQHEKRIFQLYDRMMDVRSGGDMSDDDLVGWGKDAMPIYEKAKMLIINGNDEWRSILTEEQRALHDKDVELMHQSFVTTDTQLQRIVTGDMTVDEFRSPRRMRRRPQRVKAEPRVNRVDPDRGQPPEIVAEDDAEREAIMRGRKESPEVISKPVSAKPPSKAQRSARAETGSATGKERPEPRANTPKRPEPRAARTPERNKPARETSRNRSRGSKKAPRASKNFESEWEKYVNGFITKYSLDDAQQQTARKILRDCQEQAASHVRRNQSRIDKIEQQLKDVKKDKAGASQRQRLEQQRERLMTPIGRIFERQLKPRLDRIPTSAQRKAASAPKSKAKRGKK